MDSFHFSKPSENQCSQSYIFTPEDLADIPHPDDFFDKEENSPQEDSIELPLPPGTSGDDFPLPNLFKHKFKNSSDIFSPFSHTEGFKTSSDADPGLMSECFNILPLNEDCQQKSDLGPDELVHQPMDIVDDAKYSPSKADSDEENQDSITAKPKVLGKEQAKKRLMAFSLSKQPSVKKQSKAITPVKNKEKPPNPNKGSSVQEQFRATMSAIEEEKKKMFQNMPNYLLHEMNDLAKLHSLSSPSLQNLEKRSDSKSKGSSSRDGASNKSQESRDRSSRRSGSRSSSRYKSKRRRSTSKRRSRSNSKTRSRRRSSSRSGRRSPGRRPREEKNYKGSDKSSRERQGLPKKSLPEDWSSYKSAGLTVESESKNEFDETKPRRDELSRRSPYGRTDLKPIFNYLSKGCSPMTTLQARPADPGSSSPVLFPEKIVKFTRTKPIISWAENPSLATEFYMSKQMLLENCDNTTASILLSIIENKNLSSSETQHELQQIKNRSWYPRQNYLLMNASNDSDAHFYKNFSLDGAFENEPSEAFERKQDLGRVKEEAKKGRASLDRKISLVNDSYLSDEEEQVKEMIMGEVKVQLELDKHRVKVRSKWDSDYEGENSEKESALRRGENRGSRHGPKAEEPSSNGKEKVSEGLGFKVGQEKQFGVTEKKKSGAIILPNLCVPAVEAPSVKASESGSGNLVSEYEEFLKMVSVDTGEGVGNEKEKLSREPNAKLEKVKMKKLEKSSEECRRSPRLGLTDWDQESDHEEKSKKMEFGSTGSRDGFLILPGEKSEIKKEGKRKKVDKKTEKKMKDEKAKALKRSGKGKKKKKKKYEDSCSEESSSGSCDSDSSESGSESESESDESESSRRRKRKKNSKSKKKYREESSSESESDSDDSKTRKKKGKQKKGGKKKNASSDSDEVQSALLKQLDFKKQLIMKKIEEIDSISDKSAKKKQKGSREKKREVESSDDSDSEKYKKSGKKKKAEVKVEKDKKKSKSGNKKSKLLGKGKKMKKSKSSSETESETSEDDSVKKRKSKKLEKRKRDSSKDSDTDSDEERGRKPTKSKTTGKSYKKSKKGRKDSSSSDSDSEDSSRSKTKEKKRKNDGKSDDNEKLVEAPESDMKDSLLLDGAGVKCGKTLTWERKKVWKKVEGQGGKKKEDDDWEASSSVEESEKESKARESSWDEEVLPRETKTQVHEEDQSRPNIKPSSKTGKKQFGEISQNPSEIVNLSSGTLKSSLSVFSFNENSFCSFGQELSRDFFLAELNYSNSANLTGIESSKVPAIEPRPFQSVSKDAEMMKAAHSELYSPGHSDSDVSDGETNKPEKPIGTFTAENRAKEEVYDPLNCDSEGSVENAKVELRSIPLPRVSDILLPGETRNFENIGAILGSNSEGSILKDLMRNEGGKLEIRLTSPLKSNFVPNDFTLTGPSPSPFSDGKSTPTKKQVMSVKGQPKLISKAASVFQDESDEENIEPSGKTKATEGAQKEAKESSSKERASGESRNRELENSLLEETSSGEVRKRNRDRSREESVERNGRRKRSRSRERRSRSKSRGKKSRSPKKHKKSKTPDSVREKREIRSDCFEIEPLKSCMDSNELADLVQPIPVLTNLESSNDGLWTRSVIPRCEFPHAVDNLIDNAESFDIYPSEESAFRNRNYENEFADHEKAASDKSKDHKSKKERRKSRSTSHSPKKKLKSKSPEKRRSPRSRSPRRKSASPKRKERSPFSPRRRSPKRKSPSRRCKNSRSPDKRRKSRSRSPRKRRTSPSRRSRSLSPRKYRSPKYLDESPRRRDSSATTAFSPRERFSPRKDSSLYPHPYPDSLQNRIPVIGTSVDDPDREISPSALPSPMFDNPNSFPRHMTESSAHDPDMYNSFYEGEYTDEFGMSTYPEEVSVNNLITVKNHDIEKTNSSERLSLDQRIELELGAQISGGPQAQGEQYQVCPQFQDGNYFQNSCNCDNANGDNFYPNQSVGMNDFNGQYFNGHQQQSTYRSFQQYSNSQPVQNSVLQVGNIVEVVPTPQHPPPSLSTLSSKPTPQIMQVGNVLQVVPSQKPVPPLGTQNYPDESSTVKIQKATAVVAPSSVVPTPNPEAVLSPLIKAIQLEREKRRKEKEKRKAEREARRKARQLRREAKLMLVNEKLKKSVQNEGLMLGQEVEDDELLDGSDVPSPPIPVEIITVSSPNALPPAGKGILITAGFMPKPPSEKKEVKFADGVCPGEGTSTSGGEEIASPPPKPKLPKEKRFKKRKTKVKKKVKVQIIRQIIQEEDDDEDDLSPPPPPPGDPPPVFFARFPFAGEAQFPVYQTQTTTTTLTTVQYPNQSFE